jgi:pimeloyl-ACP methyl ester carboxylesterase
MIQVEGVPLHVGVAGQGPDLVVLTGGPGCVQYLEREEISPPDHRAWYPEPRGVGRSGGGPHTMERAMADLEGIREAVGVGSWIVVGHSWGSDLAVRYGVEHPEAVMAVVGIAGKGPHRDRTWSEAYEGARAKAAEPVVDIDWCPKCTRRSAIRSPIGFTDPISGGHWPTARCRCTSSPPGTTSARPGHWRNLPRSFRAAPFPRCLAYPTTSGSPTPRCGPGPSPTPAPPCNLRPSARAQPLAPRRGRRGDSTSAATALIG